MVNLDSATFSVAIPPYTMSTREVDTSGHQTIRYFCPPGVVVTCDVGEIHPQRSTRQVVLERREALTGGQHFAERVSIASAVILPAETAQVAFLWRATTGEVQASQILAVKAGSRLFLLHVCVPANVRIPLTNKINAILESVAMVEESGRESSSGQDTSVEAP